MDGGKWDKQVSGANVNAKVKMHIILSSSINSQITPSLSPTILIYGAFTITSWPFLWSKGCRGERTRIHFGEAEQKGEEQGLGQRSAGFKTSNRIAFRSSINACGQST